MQINRLFEIVYILLDKKTITARELAGHFEVSQRTIYRDLDTLCQCGIPIYTTKGKGGGISLLDNFILNKSIISNEEQTEILSALQSLQAANYTDNNSALLKLKGIFNSNNFDWIKVDFSSWANEKSDNFAIVKNAILNRKIIQFTYYNSLGEKTIRSAEPLQLWFKSKNWYLKGFCHLKNNYRIFKLNRIKDLIMLNETFIPSISPDKIPEQTAVTSSFINLKLHIDNTQTYRVYDEFEPSDISINDDNSFIVSLSCPNNEWIYSYILSFGEHAKVLAPKSVQRIISEKINKLVKIYS